MNYLSKDFNHDYISQRIKLTWKEILYGIEKNYIYPDVAIEFAINEVSEKEEYPEELIELASLTKEESVHPYLKRLVDSEETQEDDVIRDKWLYLILDWIYNNKDKYLDSLQIVEEIYAEFDYPEQITTFVRYMPSDAPDLGSAQLNEERLYRNWKSYLDSQKEQFSTSIE
jgi:hypothetical protein